MLTVHNINVLEKIGKLIRDPGVQVDATGFIFALLVSALVAMAVSSLYQAFYENRATGSQIHRGFLLIGPSITALFIAIQFSLPLSLGLLGALSIIRFRTPIKEPEEVGFIMLLIATSVVCATFQFLLLFVLLGLALGLLSLQKALPKLMRSKRADGALLLTLQGDSREENQEQIVQLLNHRLQNPKMQSMSFAENLTTLHFSFTGFRGEGFEKLHGEIHQIVPVERLNIFFNGQGTIL
jgi:hypothetical protein